MLAAEDILAFVGDVVAQYQPERVILFGSYAYGTPTADSDADVLIVMAHRGPGHRVAARIRGQTNPRFPMDLLVRSPAEIEKRTRGNDFFLQEVMKRGLVLHAAGNPGMGAEGRKRLRRRLASSSVAKAQPA